jgi:hypothetical protein
MEAGGIPVLRFRAGIPDDPASEPDDELLIPATVEQVALERHGERRAALLAEAQAWKAAGRPAPAGDARRAPAAPGTA